MSRKKSESRKPKRKATGRIDQVVGAKGVVDSCAAIHARMGEPDSQKCRAARAGLNGAATSTNPSLRREAGVCAAPPIVAALAGRRNPSLPARARV